MNTMKKSIGGGGAGSCCSTLAVVIALCAAFAPVTSFAAWWGWKGASAGSTSYFDDTSIWYKSGSTAFTASNHHLRRSVDTSKYTINTAWDNVVTFRNLTTLTGGSLTVSYGNPEDPVIFVAEDDSPECGAIFPNALYLYQSDTNYPCLKILSGRYSFTEIRLCNHAAGEALLQLAGGTLNASAPFIFSAF